MSVSVPSNNGCSSYVNARYSSSRCVSQKGGCVPEQSSLTALLGEAALFVPGYECDSLLIVAPSDFDRLISGYRLTQAAVVADPYCT